jgi:dTDP-4-dehydrorhamnose reductase
MKILLFGKGGQVGWELQRSLAPLGELVALDFDSAEHSADFSRPESLAATVRALRPDVIVNAAAHTAVDKAESEPDLARAIHATAPGVLAREAAALGAWLVHYSTDYVFDGSGEAPRGEDAPTGPLSVYGATKLEGESLIRASGCRHLILRTSWVMGPVGRNFALTMLRLHRERAAAGNPLAVVADQVGCPTSTSTLAAACWRAIARQPQAPVLHWSDAGAASWYDVAVAIGELAVELGLLQQAADVRPITTADYPTPARRPNYSLLDCSQSRQLLELEPLHWRQALRRLLAASG